MTSLGPLGLLPVRRYLHLIAYAGLASALAYALADSPRPNWQILGFVFGLAVILSALMELVQLGLPHRQASVHDLVMNAAGAAIATVVWRSIFQRATLDRVEPPLGPTS